MWLARLAQVATNEMGSCKQQRPSWIIIFISAAAVSVSCQEQGITSTLGEGNRACPGDEVTFTCTLRGSLALAWRSPGYINNDNPLQFSTASTLGVDVPSMINGRITATATLTRNVIDNGEQVLVSTLRITATVDSMVTCSGTSGVAESIEFSISAVPGVPQRIDAREISRHVGTTCITLVTWSPPANIDPSDIDQYIVYVPSQGIRDTSSSTISTFTVPNCGDDTRIQVAAVNRVGCVGMNSSEVQLILLDIPTAPTGNGSATTEGESATTEGGSASTSVVAAASVAAVLSVIVIVLGLILFMILYIMRGKKIQTAEQMLLADVKERVEAEIDLQKVLDTSVKRNLEELYNALKLKLQSRKMQAAARDLRATLILGKESSKFNETVKDLQKVLDTSAKRNLEELYKALKLKLQSKKMQAAARDLRATLIFGRESSKLNETVKEVIIRYLKKVQLESGEDIQRAIKNMDNMVTGMTGIDKEFKDSVRLLNTTKIGTDEYKKVLDDFIKRVEEIQPGAITGFLLTFCEKIKSRNIRQVKDYYCKQSKYDFDKLGTEEDRVGVPIWMDDELDDGWKDSLHEAVQAINEAAPGLSLSIKEDEKQAIIHVLAIDKKEPYTEVEGNILMRLKEKKFITKILLGKWKNDGKKGVCIHELFHALGFHHEHQDAIAEPYIYSLDSGKQITIDKNELGFIQFESSSTTLYPCKKKCREHSEGHVCKWVLEEFPTKVNTEPDEHDMVGLNLVYPPCIDKTASNVRYRPKLGRNGMYYCGREAIIRRIFPGEEYNHSCGPDKGPNCPACRTIKSPQVKEILAGGRWQGMTGRVYCGRPFTEPGILSEMHDGICGIDDGPACPDCNKILNKEHIMQSASCPGTSV